MSTTLLIALACVVGACGFEVRGAATVDAAADDGADAGADADALPPFDATQSGVDFLPPGEETFVMENWTAPQNTTIDTTTMMVVPALPAGPTFQVGQQDAGGSIAILRVNDFTLAAGRTITVTGDRPFVLLIKHDATIAGTIDVGGRQWQRGPGGSFGGLGAGAGGTSVHDNGTGSTYDDTGAGGGGFGSTGATGGAAGPFAGGSGGPTFVVSSLTGGSGGGLPAACSNLAGGGGGALLLYAGHKLRIMGVITAGGGGGGGGVMVCATGSGPGAGGGSGGLIWIQCTDVDGTGVLAANGGGGGGGSYVGISDGGSGEDGKASTTAIANGGMKANTVEASAGGAGAIGGTSAAVITPLTAGNGGGGGGGVGRIVYRAPSLGGLLSSPPAVVP